MKTLTIIFATFASISAFAGGGSIDEGSLSYTCNFQNKAYEGQITLTAELLKSEPGPMYLGHGKTVAFQLQRRVRVNDIYLVLVDGKNLNSEDAMMYFGNLSKNVSYTNTQFEQTIKFGFLNTKSATLKCMFTAQVY